ncbi:hypothetical protein MNBD_GAMMA16-1700 [hydrothermal vent metagenome]|uniref:PilZ domain-containing protein n=1 Tax=hydrothermal vent metagenome TaxID=652676 RepID=A0A3B0ZEP2_9ZZZZ
MTEVMQTDKRRYSRIPFNAQSSLHYDNKVLDCYLVDLSVKGALVELLPPHDFHQVETNQNAQLELVLLEMEVAINMSVRVAHHNNRTLGLSCESIDSDSMGHLRRLLELNTGDPDLFNRELLQLGVHEAVRE